MVPVVESVATGVLDSVIGKLMTLLGDEYNLVKGVKNGIDFLIKQLGSMHAVLQRLADMDDDQIDVQTKEWRSKVREMSYDIEDCIDGFMLRHSVGEGANNKANFVRKSVRKLKRLWEDRQIGKEIQELKALVIEEKERHDRYNIDTRITNLPQPVVVALNPRAVALCDEARDLVGVDGPCDEIIELLKGGDEKQLKVVSIFGMAGQGKTTLAMEVYRKIEEPFDCRALVTVSRTLDIKKCIRDILFQINRSEYDRSEKWEVEQLIPTLREQLTIKRYLIVVDDIWTTSAWEIVKSTLPDNKNRSRIITTTRKRDVAKSCCTSIDGHIYEARPLSENDSCTLFFRRIFHSIEDCPNVLTEVANDILRKCGGLPLAIVSVAGLLANTTLTVEAWGNILSSISSAVEKDNTIDKMNRILSLSYFDLPHHLKICFLYLAIFPEDCTIDARNLIWRWVAEGLIPGHNRENMELLGESYLNELVNRSMVQSTRTGIDRAVKFCRVHDVILDFIVSQAMKDNFVTIWKGNDSPGNHSNKIRRISIQMSISSAEGIIEVMKNVSHLRSVYIFESDLVLNNKQIRELLDSHVLRVMNVQGGRCTFQDFEVRESFSQLKYLRIGSWQQTVVIQNLPEEIGKLQHLEMLDVKQTDIKKLPESIAQLQKLVHLFVSFRVQLPDGIGNLRTLESLSSINPCRASTKSIFALGDLKNLRQLGIHWDDINEVAICYAEEGHMKACISSLHKLLMSLRTLKAQDNGYYLPRVLMDSDIDLTDALMVSSCSRLPLQKLTFTNNICFPVVPCAIKSLVNLTRLKLQVVGEVSKESLNILTSLPMLLSLTVTIEDDDEDAFHPRHTIGNKGFRRLVKFHLYCIHEAELEFEPEAMPKLQRLKLTLKARCQFKYGQGGLVLGLQSLSSLKHMIVEVACDGAVIEEVEALENDIRGVAGAHPNRPILEVKRSHTDHIWKPDDQLIQ